MVYLLLRTVRSMVAFLVEQPSQLKYIEWPSFRSTVCCKYLFVGLFFLWILGRGLKLEPSTCCYRKRKFTWSVSTYLSNCVKLITTSHWITLWNLERHRTINTQEYVENQYLRFHYFSIITILLLVSFFAHIFEVVF